MTEAQYLEVPCTRGVMGPAFTQGVQDFQAQGFNQVRCVGWLVLVCGVCGHSLIEFRCGLGLIHYLSFVTWMKQECNWS